MRELNEAYVNFMSMSARARLLLALLLILIILYFIGASIKGGDFASYLEASGKMLADQNIYDPPYVHLRYSYSPFWAMVLMPFALFPSPVGVFIWLVVNVFLLWRTINLLRNYFEIKFSDVKYDLILWVGIILFMSRFIELNFHHAQMTIFLLWTILESIRLCDENENLKAGILIGLGIIIKVMPIVMIPYFVYRAKFKAAFFSAITVVVTFFLPMIYLGKERFIELNSAWFKILRPDSGEPADIICGDVNARTLYEQKGTIELLWEIFGGTINSKGYKVLDSHIGLIYGDAITPERAKDIFKRLESKGFASSNVVFGVGSYSLGYHTRDTFGFALKATHTIQNGKEIMIFKDPKTDSGMKKSARGMCAVVNSPVTETLGLIDGLTSVTESRIENNMLQTVFIDGKYIG